MPFGALFDRLKKALSKTQQAFTSKIRSIFSVFRKMDESTLAQIEEALILADFGPETALRLTEDLRRAYKEGRLREADQAIAYMKTDLKAMLQQGERALRFASQGPTVILMVGVNGTGKTTSIAKLCHLLQGQGKRVLIGAADTFRAAAIDQLGIWAERVRAEIVRHSPGSDPAAVCFDAVEAALARKVDALIIDTAGRLQTKEHLMRELEKMRRVLEKKIAGAPHEVLLVLDATTGQNALSQAEHFRGAVDVTGIFLAKLDGTAKGGVVFAIQRRLGIPVKFVGLGETVEDIAPFDPEEFVDGLFD